MMLIARAPVRISFAGGGTDLPAYYTRYGGQVLSVTLNRYVYTILSPAPRAAHLISANYSLFHQYAPDRDALWDGNLSLPRAILEAFGSPNGIDVFIAAQVPPGTGLGSSGSMTVSMIAALAAWSGWSLSRAEIAELACQIEIDRLGMPVGKQDQYAAAFGGLNRIRFEASRVTVERVPIAPEIRQTLERRLRLFYTGQARPSSTILKTQQRATAEEDPQVLRRLHLLKAMAEEMEERLTLGDLDGFGRLLHEAWGLKRGLAASISNDFIDRCYAAAREAGAIGGKITGAGGGGFLLLYCPEHAIEPVTKVMMDMGLKPMDVAFDDQGVQVFRVE
ncbi:hypothetical protein [Thermoflexus sp.]|uniref:GHMP family kinase ATP-binding protein n=1 Tax=Thermoflexus sp. TaxID=1969742 RepID=UPI0025DF6E3D|nr:hypothetical protein [Thermoflexus sp.]MCS6964813.1 hypothetical protein [Thermoflexus sp.]MCX7691657.1 hypothetical protein [Thermoflexus sp.]MDW8183830.1 GHMP kinase [Anaerolineae bacterium]